MPQVELIRPLEVNAPGSSELKISNRGSNSIFYGDNAQVSSTNKTGTLGVGESLTIKGPNPVWLKAEAVPALVDFEETERLPEVQLPAGFAPGHSQDMLIRSGASWAALPVGTSGTQQLIVRSDGTVGYVDTPTIWAKAWGCKGDALRVTDAAMAEGSKTVTSVTGLFVLGHVGKTIGVSGSNSLKRAQKGTVTKFNSASSVEVSFTNETGGAISSQVAVFGTDDTTAIQNALNQTGTVQLPGAKCLISGNMLAMPSNTALRGVSMYASALYQCGQSPGGKPGVVEVPAGRTKWAVEDVEIAGIHTSGTVTAVNPSNAGVWVAAGSEWAIRNCHIHHCDGANITLADSGNITDWLIENVESHDSGIDGIEINQANTFGAERGQIRGCVTHDNFLNGLELGGEGTPTVRHLIVDGLITYKNKGSGLTTQGAVGPEVSFWTLGNIESYSNEHGITLGHVNQVTFGIISSHDNSQNGIQLEECKRVTGGVLNLYKNAKRALTIVGCEQVDLTLNATENGSTASVGQAAVEALSIASSDISLRGSITNNTRSGLQMTSTARGKLDLQVSGNGGEGVNLLTCTRLTGFISAYNNVSKGLQLGSTCVRNSFIVSLGTDNASQTTGWKISDAASKENSIGTLNNECGTPFTDAGTGTLKPF